MEEIRMPVSFDDTATAFAFRSTSELRKARFLFSVMNIRWLVNAAKYLVPLAFRWKLPLRKLIRNTIYHQFCGGETLEQTAATALRLQQRGAGTLLDYGVEAREGEAEFDQTKEEFIRVIRYAASRPEISHLAIKITGFARFALMEKIQAGLPLSETETAEYQRVKARVQAVCATAFCEKMGILIDAEESWIQQPVDELAMKMMRLYNREQALIFNTYQLYRHDRLGYLFETYRQAKQEGFILGAKLVRGAYMEKERKRAAALHYPSPIQPDRAATDKDFDRAVQFCLSHCSELSFFIASHNEHSCLQALQWMQERHIPPDHPHVHFAQLYGMSDHITFNLAKAGCKVSKYLPYGPVEEVIPYLMRRAQENSAVSGQTGRELKLIKAEIRRRKKNSHPPGKI